MNYATTISVTFLAPRIQVFNELINLKDYPLWNAGMISISQDGVMAEGLKFESRSIAMGREINAVVSVMRLTPYEHIELSNNSGPIAYSAKYHLTETNNTTTVVCTLQFELKGFALNIAHSAVESMAAARITGDLEALRALITAKYPNIAPAPE